MKKFTLLFAITTIICYSLQAKDCLEEYIAKYRFPEGGLFKEINVTLQNGNLSLHSSMGNVVLQKDGIDHFTIPAYYGKAVFKRNSANEIIGVTIEALGVTLNGLIEKTRVPKQLLQ